MAKNLKLNIKNAQLAEALKLGQVKKPSISKVKKAKEPSQEVALAAPIEETEITATTPAPVRGPEASEPEIKAVTPQMMQQTSPVKKEVPSEVLPQEEIKAISAAPSPLPEKPQTAPASSTPPPSFQQPLDRKPRESYSSFPNPKPTTTGYTPRRPQSQNSSSSAGSSNAQPASSTSGGFHRPSRFGSPFSSLASTRPQQRTDTLKVPPLAKPAEPLSKPSGHELLNEPRKAVTKDFRDVKTIKKQPSRTFDSRDRQGLRDTENEHWRKRRPSNKPRFIKQEEIIRPKELSIRVPITVKDLAAAMKLKASELVAKLFMKGIILTLNDYLDDETTIQLLGHDFDCEVKVDTSEEERLRITDKTIKQEIQETSANLLVLRPPVVAFMGHVDHGKTSLIDAIRKSNRAAGEAGAITQHIGAFCCHTAVGNLTILDTPGHEAFSSMRERGADVTDIVVLVVAGDEGIRAQTLEAIQQARTAGVPILVAINKSDKPGFDPENIYRQLAENDLLPEAWGGAVITVNCSATQGTGVTTLLEMLALQAEVLELKANPSTRARGAVIESAMHKGLGAQTTVLVQNGSLKIGDALVFDQHWGRVKTIHDEYGKELSIAGPSTPVKITGLSGLPEAGSEFIVVKSEREARELGEGRTLGQRNVLMQQTKKAGLEHLLQQKAEAGERKTLNLILRADVQGSLEALKTSLLKIESKKVSLNILSTAVGEISESDIQLAAASKSTIIGFHTQIESRADGLIKEHKVTVKLHDIIYHAVDDVRGIMISLLDKIVQENDAGSAEVKAVFKSSQLGLIAGCQVTQGSIRRNQQVRVMRDNKQIWKGPIASLKRVKEDVREVGKGMECGILLHNFSDVKAGDIIQAFDVTYLEQEL